MDATQPSKPNNIILRNQTLNMFGSTLNRPSPAPTTHFSNYYPKDPISAENSQNVKSGTFQSSKANFKVSPMALQSYMYKSNLADSMEHSNYSAASPSKFIQNPKYSALD